MSVAITIFADFVCPFSYLAETSLRKLGYGVAEVRYRAAFSEARQPFQDSSAWSMLAAAANDEGLQLKSRTFAPATHKAHEAVFFARAREREELFRGAAYAAYWRDGLDIGRIDILTGVAASVGLDPEELKIALDIDMHADEVTSDLVLAGRLHIDQTPVTYIGTGAGARVVKGGYTSSQLQALLEGGAFIKESTDG